MLLERLQFRSGGKAKSKVNEAGNYTKPGMRENLFKRIKAQALAKQYKAKGGGYK